MYDKKFPPHLKPVTTLPREIWLLKITTELSLKHHNNLCMWNLTILYNDDMICATRKYYSNDWFTAKWPLFS